MAIEYTDCADCESGTKSYICSNCDGNGQRYEGRTCHPCGGDGELQIECDKCDGEGEIEHEVLYLNLSYGQAMEMKETGTFKPGLHKVYLGFSEVPNWSVHQEHYVPNFLSSPNPGDPVVICILQNELDDPYDGGLKFDGEISWYNDVLWSKCGKDRKNLEFVTE